MNFLYLLMVVVLTACSQTKTERDTMKIATAIEARNLYPYTANDPHSIRVYGQIFDTLIDRTEDGKFVPSLAESWELVSPTVFDVTIRSNVFFHNGEMLTAEDVQFSYEQILSEPSLAHTIGPVDHTEIIGDNKVRFYLKAPYAPVLHLLSNGTFRIVNKKTVLEYGKEVASHPIGTGPFKFKEWNRGQNIILSRFDEYWGEPAKIEYLDYRTVHDPVARALALETKDVDIAFDLEGSDRERLLSNNDVILYEKAIPRVEYIAMNIGEGTNPLWKDKRGRQAFSLAIDREGIISSILFGQGQAVKSLLPPSVFGHNPTLPEYKQDLAKAKELIQSLNIPNPSMTIWVREGISQKVGEVIQANLAEIGVDAKIEIVEYARFLEGIAKGEHDVFILNWTTITGDGDYGLNNLHNSKAWGSQGNRSFYSNPKIDSLLGTARQELDENKRLEEYYELQDIMNDEMAYIPLYYSVVTAGTLKDVVGFEYDMFTSYPMKTIAFKK